MEKDIKQVEQIKYEYVRDLEIELSAYKRELPYLIKLGAGDYLIFNTEDKAIEEVVKGNNALRVENEILTRQLEEYKNKPLWRRILNK